MSIYNNKHVVFEQVGLDANTAMWNEYGNTDSDDCINNYDISRMRRTVLPARLLKLSNVLQSELTNTTIQTAKNGKSTSLVSTSDKLFLLAEKEMFTIRSLSVQQEFNTLITLDYWVNHTSSSDRIKYDSTSTARYYWLRSPVSGGKNGVSFIYENGDGGYSGADHDYRFSPCFAF